MPSILRNRWVLSALFLLIAAAGVLGSWYWTHRGPQLDALIRAAFVNAEETKAYVQVVETETAIEDRHIRVVGEYTVNDEIQTFSSRATTTLTLPDGTSHSFNLHTITIGEDMYTRVVSHSAALNLTVPATGEWKQFKISSIPPEYREIATPRPPIDNLTLFRKGGEFLVLKEARRDEDREGEELARYTFGLSSLAFTEKTGPVSMIAERIGVHGTVDVWVRESDAHIRYIRFTNDPYSSATTITHTDTVPLIETPRTL